MTRTTVTEADLDSALAHALASDEKFAAWFLSRTKFSGVKANCVLVRADNPWSVVKLTHENTETGALEQSRRECETDVLAIYETQENVRIALHIENKLASGSFTHLQPELYGERLAQWRSKAKLGMYSEATSVLVAPRAFYQRNEAAARIFESFVTHEDIAVHIEAFRGPGGSAA
jgi:hypothetical protein